LSEEHFSWGGVITSLICERITIKELPGCDSLKKGVTETRVFVIISGVSCPPSGVLRIDDLDANVAQRQSSGFVNQGLSVRIRPLAFCVVRESGATNSLSPAVKKITNRCPVKEDLSGS
jgi:hypothetical protein